MAGRPSLPVGGPGSLRVQQVGCGLLHAVDIVEKNRRQRDVVERSMAHGSVPGARYGATIKHLAREMGGSDMVERLGYGNKHLFLDIYPLHRFYMERGWAEFNAHLDKRQNKRYAVHWGVGDEILSFGKPFEEIRRGFGEIESGSLEKSVKSLAWHEQVNILQAIIYNNRFMQISLAYNQLAWASEFPSGDYEEIKLTLSAQCRTSTGLTALFSKDKRAKLWVAEQRMKFVEAAADRFSNLLNGPERHHLEHSIRTISKGGGVV